MTERPVGADGHAMPALDTDHFPTGNQVGVALFILKMNDGHRAFFGAKTVFLTYALVHNQ
jgi:hypothetical protein